MIISASYKTDIPAFYGEWFLNRLRAGYCAMVNPYNQKPIAVSLAPEDVEGIVFWTKNIGPFLKHLDEVLQLSFPFVIQHTINGYAQSRFEAVVSAEEAISNLHSISERYGRHVPVWRYDPIVLSNKTTYEDHIINFTKLAQSLQGAVDEVVISFVQPYRKTQRNMTHREDEHTDFTWFDRDRFEEHTIEQKTPKGTRRVKILRESNASLDQKRGMAEDLAHIAGENGMRFSICSQKEILGSGFIGGEAELGSIGEAKCVDTTRLRNVIQSQPFASLKRDDSRLDSIKHEGNRGDCACYASRDIGDYDTCPYGCAYCYAVSSRDAAKQRFSEHVPTSVFLDANLDAIHKDFLDTIGATIDEARKKRIMMRSKIKKQSSHSQEMIEPRLFNV